MTRIDYVRRVAGVARRDPGEFGHRVRGQWEIRRERKYPRTSLTPSGDWMAEFHRLLELPPDGCRLCEEFDAVWSAMEASLYGSGHTVGKGYDAGLDLARAAYAATRHLQPEEVVETGVARGITSRVILEGLRRNGTGRLHSIDLPPLAEGWHTEAGSAVPLEMRHDWDYRRGASRRVLPLMFQELGDIALFVHDSLHSYANMAWELGLAWRHLLPGGLILCDDVEDNCAFEDFVADKGEWIVGKEKNRTGLIGAIRR